VRYLATLIGHGAGSIDHAGGARRAHASRGAPEVTAHGPVLGSARHCADGFGEGVGGLIVTGPANGFRVINKSRLGANLPDHRDRNTRRGRQRPDPFLSDFARVRRRLIAVQYRIYGGWLYGQPLQCARS
jgi:hypothetical protein